MNDAEIIEIAGRVGSALQATGAVPRTGNRVGSRGRPEPGGMDVTAHGFGLGELADGVTEDDIRKATGPTFTVELV